MAKAHTLREFGNLENTIGHILSEVLYDLSKETAAIQPDKSFNEALHELSTEAIDISQPNQSYDKGRIQIYDKGLITMQKEDDMLYLEGLKENPEDGKNLEQVSNWYMRQPTLFSPNEILFRANDLYPSDAVEDIKIFSKSLFEEVDNEWKYDTCCQPDYHT